MRSYRAVVLFLLMGFTVVSCDKTLSAPFPAIDRDKLQISLTRSGCYGTCPDYKVTIDGKGHVVFSTREDSLPGAAEAHREFNPFPYVVAPARREYAIDLKAVDALIHKFENANFFALKDEYSAQITDNPTYALEIDTGNGRKQVIDYVGEKVGMPAVVTELENAVDQTAQTGRWVYGADGLVDALAAERFDFHSEDAARMLLQSIENGGDHTLLELVRRGAPLDLPSSGGSYGSKGTYGNVALLTSIREGRTPLFRALVAGGWLKRASGETVADAFVESGVGCRPQLVEEAVKAGIPVDVRSSPAGDGIVSNGHETALSSLAQSYGCDDESDRLKTASRLLAHGADPNLRDEAGESAIFGVENLGLLNLLLASGADATILNKRGNSAIFSTWTDDIVLRLLQAGANPKGSDDGKTLWETIKEHPMPKAKAWLERHPTALAAAKTK